MIWLSEWCAGPVEDGFFRDFRCLNYWGRIPKELIRNGAAVYYGQQQSAAVEDSGRELAERIRQIVEETGY